MKTRYLALVAIVSLVFLSGCQNRFNDYEPYSSFDDRMAEAGRPPMTPDDQMPPMDDAASPYASADSYDSYSSSGADYSSGPRRQAMNSSSSSDLEVPYSDTRKKHAYNVGGFTN
jgi:hypothetical protein